MKVRERVACKIPHKGGFTYASENQKLGEASSDLRCIRLEERLSRERLKRVAEKNLLLKGPHASLEDRQIQGVLRGLLGEESNLKNLLRPRTTEN